MVVTTVNASVVNEILEKTKLETGMHIQFVFKSTLRQLISQFNNIYYIDGNNQIIKIKCVHANQERAVGMIFSDQNLILPFLTISETSTANSDGRRRYSPILVHEKYWDEGQQRAIRLLSLAPRPVDITYQINVWSYYKNDLDQIRESIMSMFNPALELETEKNLFTKIFINSEQDASELEVPDREDRLLQKNIILSAETYIPSPKFLYTSTGKIEKFNSEVTLVSDITENFNTPIIDQIIN